MSDNALIAASVDSTNKPWSGFGPMDAIEGFSQAVESKQWADIALAGVGGALEGFSFGVDPIGSLLSGGISWLIEYVDPLNEVLHDLTGDADILYTHAGTWTNMAGEAWAMAADLYALMESSTEEWVGAAGDAFRELHTAYIAGIDCMGWVFDSMSKATAGAAQMLQVCYELVRDLIAELIGTLLVHAPVWLGLIAATAGAATPLCLADAIIIIVNIAGLVFSLVMALIGTFQGLDALLNS
jgi:hypothetical protein